MRLESQTEETHASRNKSSAGAGGPSKSDVDGGRSSTTPWSSVSCPAFRWAGGSDPPQNEAKVPRPGCDGHGGLGKGGHCPTPNRISIGPPLARRTFPSLPRLACGDTPPPTSSSSSRKAPSVHRACSSILPSTHSSRPLALAVCITRHLNPHSSHQSRISRYGRMGHAFQRRAINKISRNRPRYIACTDDKTGAGERQSETEKDGKRGGLKSLSSSVQHKLINKSSE
jgi:hypothetical protein